MDTLPKLFRSLPLFKGKERLARLLFKGRIARDHRFWVKGTFGCEYLVPNLVENIGFEIFINGIYEEETSDFIARRLPPGGVFLDLGANIGAISVPLHKKRKDITMVCVEAEPRIFSYLQENLNRNGVMNVHAVNNALFYNDNEEMNFFSPEDKFGKGSLSPVFTDKAVKVTTVKVDTLIDRLSLPTPAFIKIDVEGYEYHVFKGATALLSRADAPDILFEFADWAEEHAEGIAIGAAQQQLFDLGYRLFYFNSTGKMEELKEVLKKGFFMLFATKKGSI